MDSFQDQQARIDAIVPNKFVIVKKLSSDKYLFLDTSRSVEFEYTLRSFVSELKRNPDRIFGQTTEERVLEYQSFMDALSPGRFRVIGFYWDTSGTKIEFEDIEREVITSGFKSSIKAKLTKDPKYLFKPSQSESRIKYEKTCLNKYGTASYSNTEEFKDKYKTTNLERYGVEHPMKSEDVLNKVFTTNIERYGTHHSCTSDSINKAKSTSLEKYGEICFSKTDEFLEKSKSTLKLKYGADNPARIQEFKDKAKITRISRGIQKTYHGMTIREVSDSRPVSYPYTARILRNLGEELGIKYLDTVSENDSGLESFFVNDVLNKLGVEYHQRMNIDGMKPDFVLPDHKLIIECDGLYWHSDAKIDNKRHHYDRLLKFESLGYRVLAFREDEIKNKINIIRSIVSNSIGNSIRVGARKLKFCEVDSKFFDDNHLMGCGSKKSGIGLSFNNEPLIAMSFKRVANKPGWWEIDRLCTKMGYQVPGGVSRILRRFSSSEHLRVQTFVDRRYGTGKGLTDIGFVKVSEAPSFRWTNFQYTQHRLKFGGNSGYSTGLHKIWDYGQAKFILFESI